MTNNLLDKLSSEDLEKIREHKSNLVEIDNEWLVLAEFAQTYGWEAYKDAVNDRISANEMMTLLQASRKLEAMKHYKQCIASFVGAGSANSKKPNSTFKKMTRDIIKQAKI
jgi:hypothetical protein